MLIDESHNFRHSDTQRYRVVQSFLAAGKRCCFLTATPRNKSAWDIYTQIKLFHQDDITELPIHPANLRDYFNMVDRGERTLPELLSKILVRRTRNHILRWYGFDAETHEPVDPSDFAPYRDGSKRAYVIVANKPQFFPRRELKTIEYSIEATYLGLYERIRDRLGRPGIGTASPPDGESLLRPLRPVELPGGQVARQEGALREPPAIGEVTCRSDADPALQALRVERARLSRDGAEAAGDAPRLPRRT